MELGDDMNTLMANEKMNPVYVDILTDLDNVSIFIKVMLLELCLKTVLHYLNDCPCKVEYLDEVPELLAVHLSVPISLEDINTIHLN